MKKNKKQINNFLDDWLKRELISLHDYYKSNGLWSGDVYEIKEEFEKTFQSELYSGVKTKINNSSTTFKSV